MSTDHPTVRIGQLWADNDKRSEGRHLLVVDIDTERGRAQMQEALSTGEPLVRANMKPRLSWVSISRMRPTSTGYRLVLDVPTPTPKES